MLYVHVDSILLLSLPRYIKSLKKKRKRILILKLGRTVSITLHFGVVSNSIRNPHGGISMNNQP